MLRAGQRGCRQPLRTLAHEPISSSPGSWKTSSAFHRISRTVLLGIIVTISSPSIMFFFVIFIVFPTEEGDGPLPPSGRHEVTAPPTPATPPTLAPVRLLLSSLLTSAYSLLHFFFFFFFRFPYDLMTPLQILNVLYRSSPGRSQVPRRLHLLPHPQPVPLLPISSNRSPLPPSSSRPRDTASRRRRRWTCRATRTGIRNCRSSSAR